DEVFVLQNAEGCSLGASDLENALYDQICRAGQVEMAGLDLVLGFNNLGQDAGIGVSVGIFALGLERSCFAGAIVVFLQDVSGGKQLLEGCFVEYRSAALSGGSGHRVWCVPFTRKLGIQGPL